MTTTTPRNDNDAPANFAGVSVSAPDATARTAVSTGVAAMMQRAVTGRDRLETDRPQDLVQPEPKTAEDEDPHEIRRAARG